MKIKVIILSFLITTVLSLNFVVPQLIQERLQAYIYDVQQSAQQYGLALDFEDVRMSYIPFKIRINGMNLKTAKGEGIFSSGRIDFSNWDFAELVRLYKGELSVAELSKMRIAIQKLEFNEDYLSPKLKLAMRELGYEKLILNVVSDYDYKSESKDLFLNELSLEGQDMGKVSVSAHLKDFEVPTAYEVNEMNSLNQASIKSFMLEYTEGSLVKNIKVLADKNNLPVDRYLAFGKKLEGNRDPASDKESDVTSGLKEFVNNPKSMKFAVSPEKEIPFKDISLMMMLSPAKLIDSLQPQLVINGSEIHVSQ